MAALPNVVGSPMIGRPTISRDIRRPQPRRPASRGELPLPPGMPRRTHVAPTAEARQAVARPKRTRQPARTRQNAWEYAQYPLIATVALVAAINTTIGQLIVLAYAVAVVFIWRQPSRLTFALAFIILLSVGLFQIINQPDIAENAAIYVYELLVVGTISAILELKLTSSTL